MKWYDLKYLMGYLLPIAAILAVWGTGIYCYAVVIVAFILIPGVELFTTGNTKNETVQDEQSRLNNRFFDCLLYIHPYS